MLSKKYLFFAISTIFLTNYCHVKAADIFFTEHPVVDVNQGWKNLLADDLSNCIYKKDSWSLDNSVLERKGGGNLWTKENYSDFILDFEFKVEKNSNSGIFIRTVDINNYVQTGIEVQIHDSTDGTKHGQCGAIYDCLSPRENVTRKTGQWNRMTILARGSLIEVVINSQQVISMDLDNWAEPHKNPDGTKNKFNTAYKDMPRLGHIGFQDHGNPVWFRNIRIKPLPQLAPKICLIDENFSCWLEKDDWQAVGEALMSPVDEKLIATQPGTGVIVNGPIGRTVHLVSKDEFGDVIAHIEFMVPKGSNSGVYFQGRYEIQIFDSWGVKEPNYSDCGGIYQRWENKTGFDGHPPKVNASLPPGQWQSFDVIFRAPRFDKNGKKIANAVFEKVLLNGTLVQENVELTGPTRSAIAKSETPTGPLMLQGNHGPVAYRNIWIIPLYDKQP